MEVRLGPETIFFARGKDDEVTHPRMPFAGRSVDCRHLLQPLSIKPQALRQVAHELVAQFGAPWPALWAALHARHSPDEIEAAAPGPVAPRRRQGGDGSDLQPPLGAVGLADPCTQFWQPLSQAIAQPIVERQQVAARPAEWIFEERSAVQHRRGMDRELRDCDARCVWRQGHGGRSTSTVASGRSLWRFYTGPRATTPPVLQPHRCGAPSPKLGPEYPWAARETAIDRGPRTAPTPTSFSGVPRARRAPRTALAPPPSSRRPRSR